MEDLRGHRLREEEERKGTGIGKERKGGDGGDREWDGEEDGDGEERGKG